MLTAPLMSAALSIVATVIGAFLAWPRRNKPARGLAEVATQLMLVVHALAQRDPAGGWDTLVRETELLGRDLKNLPRDDARGRELGIIWLLLGTGFSALSALLSALAAQ